MSKGQVQLLRQILGAGGDTSHLPLAEIRANFERLLARFPALDGEVFTEPVDLPGAAEGVRAEWIDARRDRSDPAMRTILYLHGGGFVLGSITSHQQMIARLSRFADARCFALDYRLAPEHPYPAALEDALHAYRFLLNAESSPAIAGDSAGAGLGILVCTRLRDAGEPAPPALVCFSPWTDYSGSGESLKRNAHLDPVVRQPGLDRMAALYLAGRDPWDPELCPLTADLEGLPPLLIQAGGSEALLDDALRLHERATDAGVASRLDVWPDMIHVWHLFAGRLGEGEQALEAAGDWLREQRPRDESRGPATANNPNS